MAMRVKTISVSQLRKNLLKVLADIEVNKVDYVVCRYNTEAAVLKPFTGGRGLHGNFIKAYRSMLRHR